MLIFGDWKCSNKSIQDKMNEIIDKIKKKLPNAIINDRLGNKEDKKMLNYLGKATYRTYNDRALPVKKPSVPWVHINTIGYSWGRNKEQKKKDYKTGEELYTLYKQVKKLGGGFLLNFGPSRKGKLDKMEVKSFKKFGKLVKF